MVFSAIIRGDEEDQKIIAELWTRLYKDEYKIIDIRRVYNINTTSIGFKIGRIVKWAGFDVNKPVYIRIKGNDIIIRQDGNGLKRKIAKSNKYYKIIIGDILRALGIDIGDKVVIKVKDGEIVVTPLEHELNKLEKIKEGNNDDREDSDVCDFII